MRAELSEKGSGKDARFILKLLYTYSYRRAARDSLD